MFATEILQVIFGVLAEYPNGPDIASLKNCLLASKDLNSAVQEFMFTHFSVADKGIERCRGDITRCLCLRKVLKLFDEKKLIGHRVRKLDLYAPLSRSGHLIPQIKALLDTMTNVTRLSIEPWNLPIWWKLAPPPWDQDPIYYINTFPFFKNLVELRLCDIGRFPVKFLVECSSLKHLHIIDTSLEPLPDHFRLHGKFPLRLSSLTYIVYHYHGFGLPFKGYEGDPTPEVFDFSQLSYLSIRQHDVVSILIPSGLLKSAEKSIEHLVIDLCEQEWDDRSQLPLMLLTEGLHLQLCPRLTMVEIQWMPSTSGNPFAEAWTLIVASDLQNGPGLQFAPFIQALCAMPRTLHLSHISVEDINACDLIAAELLRTFEEVERCLGEKQNARVRV
ncbi:hypothetical protein BJ165DRAFT_1616221 [Panaeolus papilionaceus]|nr:hypothetical protein BJ165DRAFT_1616221 [Panaeolus papilionaceus]